MSALLESSNPYDSLCVPKDHAKDGPAEADIRAWELTEGKRRALLLHLASLIPLREVASANFGEDLFATMHTSMGMLASGISCRWL